MACRSVSRSLLASPHEFLRTMTTPNPVFSGVLSVQSVVEPSGKYAVMVACVDVLPTRKMTSASAFVFTASIGVSLERWSARHAATGLS